jgi:2-keto-4-pentenoate hydratase
MSDHLEAGQISAAVEQLLTARRNLTTIPALSTDVRPADLADAYAIQDALHAAGGWSTRVSKVGGTSEAAQQRLGVPEPIVGLVPADATFESGAVIPLSRFHHRPMLECEFGLRLAVDVDPATDIDSDMRGLVDALVPAFEIVDTRFDEMLGVDGPSLVADNSGSAGAVLGRALPISATDDLVHAAITLSSGDDVLAEGTGVAALGDPFESLRWFLRHQRGRSKFSPAGGVVITGTCTGLIPVPIGAPAIADFGPWGRIEVTFSEE